MSSRRYAGAVIVSVVAAGVAATGCTKSGGPAAGTSSGVGATTSSSLAGTTTSPIATSAPPATAPVAPSGAPVGTAVMKVSCGSAPVTIRYRINGGPEETEANVALPWEKQYPVYNELESKVSADGGDTALTCTIIMDGDKVVAFKSEPRPACSFAYWG